MRRSTTGFTIIELLVVIGIIVILVGLTISGVAAMTRQSEHATTNDTLELLEMAMQEWEHAAERKLTWGDGAIADVDRTTPPEMILTVALERMLRCEPAADIIASIAPSRIYRFEPGLVPDWVVGNYDPMDYGSITIMDAWDVPIYALHPGAVVSDPDDDDGTERTLRELQYGIATHRTMCFISAGPDQQFGYMQAPDGTLFHEQAEDNVYSYPVETNVYE